MTNVSRHADWLSLTFRKGAHHTDVFPLGDWRYTGAGLHGYRFQYKDTITGMVWQEGSDRDEMGCHLTISGEALNMLRSHWGGDDNAIIAWLSHWEPHASRIDLTVDIHEGQLTPRKCYHAVKDGTLKAKTRTYRFIEGKNGDITGDTLYLGSPQSDRLLRAYDKAAEQRIEGGANWLRLELQLRSDRAKGAFQSARDNGTAETVAGHMEDFIHWNNREYQQAISGGSAAPYELPSHKTNRQRWLLTQCAPALAKECTLSDDFTRQFLEELQRQIDMLKV